MQFPHKNIRHFRYTPPSPFSPSSSSSPPPLVSFVLLGGFASVFMHPIHIWFYFSTVWDPKLRIKMKYLLFSETDLIHLEWRSSIIPVFFANLVTSLCSMCGKNSIMFMNGIFLSCSVDEHLGWFHRLATVNNASWIKMWIKYWCAMISVI